MTTTAAEEEDEDVLGAALDDEDSEEPPEAEETDPDTGFPPEVLDAFEPLPPPPHPAASATAAVITASLCSLRIIASCARSYNWLVPIPPQQTVEPLGFP
jgi:hypothetical protein